MVHICGLFDYIEYTFTMNPNPFAKHSETSLKWFFTQSHFLVVGHFLACFFFSGCIDTYILQCEMKPNSNGWMVGSLYRRCAIFRKVNGIRVEKMRSKKKSEQRMNVYALFKIFVHKVYEKANWPLRRSTYNNNPFIFPFEDEEKTAKRNRQPAAERKNCNQIQTQINKVGLVSLFLSLGRKTA